MTERRRRGAESAFGLASRLDYLLIPLLFAVGTASVTMVGTNMGAGRFARARNIAWTASLFSAAVTGAIGFAAAFFPRTWMGLFSDEANVVAAGAAYLTHVAPLYPFFGVGMALYFASQGAGKMRWPFVAGLVRLSIVAGIGGYWVNAAGSLSALYWVVAASYLLFGAINAFGMTTGRAWRRSLDGYALTPARES